MRKNKMFFKMITRSILRRKSRMAIALLSLIVGSMVMCGLLAIYFDIPQQLSKEFRNYGANMIFVAGKDETVIKEDDWKTITNAIDSSDLVGISAFQYETVKINENPFYFAGTDLSQVKKTNPYWYVDGDWPDSENEVLLGKELADLFSLKIGESCIIIGGTSDDDTELQQTVTISGILQTGGSEEEMMFGSRNILTSIIPNNENGFNIVEASLTLNESELTTLGKVIEKDTDNRVGYQVVEKLTTSENSVSKKLTLLIFLVTVVVLLITLICIGTTMMSVVLERRKEIGLKKALGAKNKQIVNEFIGEGCVLGFLGGSIGLVFGYLFARAVSLEVFGRLITFHWYLIPITIFLSIVIVLLASLFPVKSAVKVDPATVLKGE